MKIETEKELAKPDQPSIWDIAKKYLKASSNDKIKSRKMLARKLLNDRAFFNSHVKHIIDSACEYDVGLVLRQNRLTAWTAPNYDPGGNGARVHALAAGYLRMMMNFPLPGGKIMGTAVRNEVADASAYYLDKERDAGHKSRWLALIAKNMRGNKTVSQNFTEEQLRKFKEESEHA